MKLSWLNFRNWPHPNYGKWGGSRNTCHKDEADTPDGCPLPIDRLDAYYRSHDITNDDWALFKGAITTNPLTLKEKPVFAQAYWLGTIVIFGIAGIFTKGD